MDGRRGLCGRLARHRGALLRGAGARAAAGRRRHRLRVQPRHQQARGRGAPARPGGARRTRRLPRRARGPSRLRGRAAPPGAPGPPAQRPRICDPGKRRPCRILGQGRHERQLQRAERRQLRRLGRLEHGKLHGERPRPPRLRRPRGKHHRHGQRLHDVLPWHHPRVLVRARLPAHGARACPRRRAGARRRRDARPGRALALDGRLHARNPHHLDRERPHGGGRPRPGRPSLCRARGLAHLRHALHPRHRPHALGRRGHGARPLREPGLRPVDARHRRHSPERCRQRAVAHGHEERRQDSPGALPCGHHRRRLPGWPRRYGNRGAAHGGAARLLRLLLRDAHRTPDRLGGRRPLRRPPARRRGRKARPGP